ncbi:MAG: DUF1131 family protein [Sulfurimonadaceae bacterium]|nr:DUF1131 family protein [Sulfurimonadaceae bacterium]
MGRTARFTKTLFVSSLLLFFYGCGEPKKGLPYAIEVDEDHVGRIKADTPYDTAQIALLMPGFEIKPFTSFVAGEPHSVLHLTYHNQPVMTITPTKEGNRIDSVTVHSPEITAQHRFSIGETFNKIFQHTGSCTKEKESASSLMSCQAPGSRTIFYLFSTDSAEANQHGSDATQHSWPVEAIIWKPHA